MKLIELKISSNFGNTIDKITEEVIHGDVVTTSDNWQDSHKNNIPKKFIADVSKLDFSSIKTYMICKKTVFNRSYLKRMYPNLQKVILPEKADIILYDENANFGYKALSCHRNTTYSEKYFMIEGKDDVYCLDDTLLYNRNIYNIKDKISREFGKIISYVRVLSNKLKGDENRYINKCMHIDDFLSRNSIKDEPMLNKETALSYISQLTTTDNKIKNLALDSISSYNDVFLGTKFTLFYIANLKSTIKARNKSVYYANKFSNLFRRLGDPRRRYCPSIFDHINDILVGLQTFAVNDEDKKISLAILNSDEFASIFCVSNTEYKINFSVSLTGTKKEEAKNSLSDFLI